MLQKIFLGTLAAGVILWWVYVYQTRADNMMIEVKKEAIVAAHNAFYPTEWQYTSPLHDY